MGWKLTSLVIQAPGNITDEQLLAKLYPEKFKNTEDVTFDECIYPANEETVYLGNYRGNLIISTYAHGLVSNCFTKKFSKAEEAFLSLFPQSEIGAFELHSGSNYYAWSIISGGQKIRVKQGDADSGITCDFGAPLPEEQDLIKLSFKDEEGVLKYNWPGKNGRSHIYTEDHVGENYVSSIWKRFTGTELFEDDELLNETPFRSYQLEEGTRREETGAGRNIWQRLFGK